MSTGRSDSIFESLVQTEKEKALLLSLVAGITACQSKEDVQQMVSEKLSRYFNFNEIMICLDNADGETHTNYIHTISAETMQHPDFARGAAMKYYIADGIYDAIQAAEKVVFFQMEELIKRKDRPYYVDFFYECQVSELIGFPLRANNKSFGAIYVYVKSYRRFTVAELSLAQAVCASISVAIANIKAYEKISEQLSEINTYKNSLEAQKQYLVEELAATHNFDEIIGAGKGLRQTMELVRKVAVTNTTVILLGETGTGKELIARSIHNASCRRAKLMIKINCAAIPSSLIESELFGHEKGSFTGATERRIGKFELASGSTLMLDEIGEMPLDAQAKLLRVLQDGEFERIGGNTTIKTDVRIVAATNRNLNRDVQEGKFRMDLFYRLYAFPISIPPLRERIDDIRDLVEFFIAKYRRSIGSRVRDISPQALLQLQAYQWPGNVRELEHLIERSILLSDGEVISSIVFPADTGSTMTVPDVPAYGQVSGFTAKSLDDVNRDWIIRVLQACNGKIHGRNGAAELLKLPPSTLQSKLKKLGINKAFAYNGTKADY